MDAAQILRSTPLGQELGDHSDALAALMSTETVSAGQPLFEAGSAADALFVVVGGELNVVLKSAGHQEDLVVAVLGAGSVVGELEIFTGDKHMASVVATQDSTCLRLPVAVLRERPPEHEKTLSRFVDVIAKVLAVRLAAVNNKLVAAWDLPEAGAEDGDMSAPPLHDVLDDVWRW